MDKSILLVLIVVIFIVIQVIAWISKTVINYRQLKQTERAVEKQLQESEERIRDLLEKINQDKQSLLESISTVDKMIDSVKKDDHGTHNAEQQ